MNRVIAFVAFIFASRLFALFAFYPVAAQLYTAFDPSLYHLPLLLGCYSAFQTVFQLVWAALAQHFGRLRMIRIGLFLFAFSSLIAMAAPRLEVLLLARSLQGASAIGATTQALLADYIHDLKKLQTAYYQIGIAIVLSFMLSFIAAPLFQPAWLFFVVTASLAISGLVGSYFLPPIQQAAHSSFTTKKLRWVQPSQDIILTLNINFSLHFLQALILGSYHMIVHPKPEEIGLLFVIALLLCLKPLKERRLELSFNLAQRVCLITMLIGFLWSILGFTHHHYFLAFSCSSIFILLLLLEASLPSQLRASAGDYYPLWIGVYTTLQSLSIGLGSFCLYFAHVTGLLAFIAFIFFALLAYCLSQLKRTSSSQPVS